MSRNTRAPIRHCPLCGIAMQASRSDGRLPYFDRFECLTCDTVIELPQTPPAPLARADDDDA